MVKTYLTLRRQTCHLPADLITSAAPFVATTNFQSLTNCPRFATDSEPLSFQPITNCPICKSFALITIQQCRGWVGPPFFHRTPLPPISSLECAVPRFRALSPLECADAKTRPYKPFRMRSYEKTGGRGVYASHPSSLRFLCSLCASVLSLFFPSAKVQLSNLPKLKCGSCIPHASSGRSSTRQELFQDEARQPLGVVAQHAVFLDEIIEEDTVTEILQRGKVRGDGRGAFGAIAASHFR